MASVNETKTQLAAAKMKAGEAIGAGAEALTYIRAAVDSVNEAAQIAAAAFDGSGHDSAMTAMTQFNKMESELRLIMDKINDAEMSGAGGIEACEFYISVA